MSNEYLRMLDWIGANRRVLGKTEETVDYYSDEPYKLVRIQDDPESSLIYSIGLLTLNQGVPFFVAEDPCMMIGEAAASLSFDEPFTKDLLPEPWGVMYLEKPIPLKDGSIIRALGWARNSCDTCNPGVCKPITFHGPAPKAMLTLSTVEDEAKAFCELKSCTCPGCGAWVSIYGSVPFHALSEFVKSMPFRHGRSGVCCDLEVCEEREIFQPIIQYFTAALLFLDQKLVTQERAQLDRATRRRAEREGSIPDVRVVYLRKTERRASQGPEEAHTVDWSCRWKVGSHWRKQWYPSTKSYRRRYIGSYIKGPDDKPYRGRGPTVYGVVR